MRPSVVNGAVHAKKKPLPLTRFIGAYLDFLGKSQSGRPSFPTRLIAAYLDSLSKSQSGRPSFPTRLIAAYLDSLSRVLTINNHILPTQITPPGLPNRLPSAQINFEHDLFSPHRL
jgi:hypothetical protein